MNRGAFLIRSVTALSLLLPVAGTFVLAAGGQEVPVESPQASEWYQYVTLDAGVLEITAAGERELVLRPARELGQDVMYFRSLKLDRVP